MIRKIFSGLFDCTFDLLGALAAFYVAFHANGLSMWLFVTLGIWLFVVALVPLFSGFRPFGTWNIWASTLAVIAMAMAFIVRVTNPALGVSPENLPFIGIVVIVFGLAIGALLYMAATRHETESIFVGDDPS